MKGKNHLSLLLILSLAWVCTTVNARTYAVCVGLSDYPGTVNDLVVSANDALSMQRLIQANDPSAVVVVLTNRNATLSRVKAAMQRVFLAAGPQDDIVFFFSGHGLKGSFVCYDGRLTYNSILAALGRSRARSKVVYADACYAGNIRQNTGKANSKTPKNVMFFLSSRNNEKSAERRGASNSVFTSLLLTALNGAADTNHDQVVTAVELFNYVHGQLNERSRSQHAVMWGHFDRNMPVMKLR